MADNPQAFPPNAGWRDNDPNQRGMTLLDYFAGQALVALAVGWNQAPADAAQRAYAIAAAMLNERQSHEG